MQAPPLELILDIEAQNCSGCFFSLLNSSHGACLKHKYPEYAQQSCIVRTNKGERMGKFIVKGVK